MHWPPSGSIAVQRLNAISFPFADHAGAACATPPPLSARAPPPLLLITKRWKVLPPRLLRKAICLPFGDAAGSLSSAVVELVRFFNPAPPALIE